MLKQIVLTLCFLSTLISHAQFSNAYSGTGFQIAKLIDRPPVKRSETTSPKSWFSYRGHSSERYQASFSYHWKPQKRFFHLNSSLVLFTERIDIDYRSSSGWGSSPNSQINGTASVRNLAVGIALSYGKTSTQSRLFSCSYEIGIRTFYNTNSVLSDDGVSSFSWGPAPTTYSKGYILSNFDFFPVTMDLFLGVKEHFRISHEWSVNASISADVSSPTIQHEYNLYNESIPRASRSPSRGFRWQIGLGVGYAFLGPRKSKEQRKNIEG